MITGGLCTSAWATSTRRFMPPDSCAHVGVRLVRQIQPLDDLVDPGIVVAQTEVARLDAQGLAHGEERIEHQFLRHHAERAPRDAVVGHHVVAHDTQRAAVGARQAGQDADQRGLAGAVRARAARRTRLARCARLTPSRAAPRRSACGPAGPRLLAVMASAASTRERDDSRLTAPGQELADVVEIDQRFAGSAVQILEANRGCRARRRRASRPAAAPPPRNRPRSPRTGRHGRLRPSSSCVP